ncbi:MAG: cobalamin-binding protein [Candidatus Poribacteria bacterium]|nr:MAG: cobalamin-binding protein [Candidatus Poribacteria bacterium]
MSPRSREAPEELRIVSLLPSATEIVCALGLRGSLVGISHDCDWPPGIAEEKPALSATVVPTDLPSREIDRRVREQAHQGRSVYHLDAGRLAQLRPDLILTQELCAVCAPSFTEVQRAAKILDAAPKIVSLEPHTLGGILENILLVGELTRRQEKAQVLVESLRSRIERVRTRTQGISKPPRVLAIEWLDPPFLAGHWVPEMLQIAGAVPPNAPGDHSTTISWEEIAAFDPEAIILMPCGFSPERTLKELPLLVENPSWRALRAVRQERVALVHGSYYFNRPGPRVVDGLELLAWWLHPERFIDLEPPSDGLITWKEALHRIT